MPHIIVLLFSYSLFHGIFQVPIVKLTDKESEVKVDVSFNMDNNQNYGVESAQLIQVRFAKRSSCFIYIYICSLSSSSLVSQFVSKINTMEVNLCRFQHLLLLACLLVSFRHHIE